ncbi:MAG TPA: hypothetical protein VGX24_06775 [Pyrinomonadaceae bacterium]|jgi:hypothetical protein|nr:hypothetical protein [Pyrinomonadaceae bacterium]
MINLQTGEQTYVSRLRVTRSGLDPLATRLRLASLFQTAEVQPAGLAPSAIVCIRRLDDPRPRTVLLSSGHTSLPPEWQQSVRASIEQLVRRAPRPAREAAGEDAPCVVFADRAELLAAVAGDWYEQRAVTRWWWRSLFKETPDAAALVKLWRLSPEYVPGALEHLARRQRAVPFARALASSAARSILDNLTHRFALTELQVVLSSAPPDDQRAGDEARAGATPPDISAHDTTRKNLQLSSRDLYAGDAPWRDFAPEASSDELQLSQRCLLGIGLTLQRAPVVARSRSFALRAAAWIDALSTGRETNATPPRSNAKEARDTDARAFDYALEHDPAAMRDASNEREDHASSSAATFDGAQKSESATNDVSVNHAEIQGAGERAPSSRIASGDDAPDVRDETAQIASSDSGERAATSWSVESVAPEVDPAGHGVRARVVEPLAAQVGEHAADAPPASVAATPETPVASPLLEAQVETRFGGLFHLVNLALFLNLYGDFTTPAEPGIALPIWDFVALLGRRLCGARVEGDAVWPLLAQLAGRDAAQLPGEDFHPPDAWRVQAGWLRMFTAPGVWRWAIRPRGAHRQSRLQVIHPAKFLVLDVPLEDEAEAQLARELEVYAGGVFEGTPLHVARASELRAAARPFKLRGRTPVARWVECLHLYARARLRLALGTNDARRAARLLCERRARVFVTATHVDIVMSLAELPFAVRVSGLDRDPGWIPAAGRVVAFHFE